MSNIQQRRQHPTRREAWRAGWAVAFACAWAGLMAPGAALAEAASTTARTTARSMASEDMPHVHCEMRQSDRVAELRAWPKPDPYAPTRLVFEDRFSLTATVLGEGARIDHITLQVHDLSQDGSPVPLHVLRLSPPYAGPKLTGWQHVYAEPLGRELQYRCTLAQADKLLAPDAARSALATQPAPLAAHRPVTARAHDAQPVVRMAFMGDVMLADGPGRLIRRGGNPFGPVASALAQADVRVANLECVIGKQGKALDKPWTFQAHPRVLPLLKRHVDVVSLANNHSGDFGPEAFAEMLQRLEAAALPYFGGGRDLRSAHRAHVVERKGVKIALLGYNEMFPRRFEAGMDWPGVAWSQDEQVLHDIRQARQVADVVIPFMHWGQEGDGQAHARQRQLARLMIDAGADAVVGTHPHVVQDTERYQGKPIFYSLGNFVFDGFSSRENNTGWILWLDVTRAGVKHWRVQEVRQDRHGTPHPLRGATPQPPMPESGVSEVGVMAAPALP